MPQVDHDYLDEERDETNHKERREDLGVERSAKCMTRNDQKAAPLQRQRSGVTFVSLFIDRHNRSPLPSGKCLPASRACNSNDATGPAPPPRDGTGHEPQRRSATRPSIARSW